MGINSRMSGVSAGPMNPGAVGQTARESAMAACVRNLEVAESRLSDLVATLDERLRPVQRAEPPSESDKTIREGLPVPMADALNNIHIRLTVVADRIAVLLDRLEV